MRITIIGAGNMGGTTATGLLRAGHVGAQDITVTAAHPEKLKRFKDLGMNTSLDNLSAVKRADAVIIAVKPYLAEQVIRDLKAGLSPDCLFISFAAGIDHAQLSQWLDGQVQAIVPALPNTAIELCQSMTFLATDHVSKEKEAQALALFEGTGTTLAVNEKQLAAGLALASCGIAYAMRYIQASAQGGVELGFFPEQAVRIVCQTVKGAASMISEHGFKPQDEIDKVTTPGGITIRGLNAMEAAGFTAAVLSGLKASKK